MMSRETERDLAAMVKVEKRAKETARAERDAARAEAADLRRQLIEEQGDRAEALRALDIVIAERDEAHNEIDDLRRQVAHANRWRDSAILEANEARAEAADLRRQLAEAEAEIAALRTLEANGDGNSPLALQLWSAIYPDGQPLPDTPHRAGKGDTR